MHFLKIAAMENLSVNVDQPRDLLGENLVTLHSFMRDSFNEAKKQFGDGVSFIKEEFSFMYERTNTCLNRMALPVNNFLKDLTQIESEFQQELYKESGQFICMHGKMVHVDEALCQPMEENY